MSISCDANASYLCAGLPAVAAITAGASPAPTSPPRTDACGGAQELLKKYLSASPCVFVRGQASVQLTYSGTDATASHSWSYPGAIVNVGVTPTSQITVVLPSQSGVTNTQTGSAIGAADMEFRYKQFAFIDRVHGILGGLLLTYEAPTGSPGLAAPGPSYQINPLFNIALNRARTIAENLSFPVTSAPSPGGRAWSFAPQAVTLWRSPGGTLLAMIVQYGFSNHATYLTLNTAQLISRNFQLQGTFGGNSMPINYDSPIQDVEAAKNGTYSHSFTIGLSYMMGHQRAAAAMNAPQQFDVVAIGAGPAGTAAALRAAELGAKTALITRDAFGGMSANEGPIPVRTLAHAARLAREARQLRNYGIVSSETPSLDYTRLVARAREVVAEAREQSTLLKQIGAAGVTLFEHAGTTRFVDAHSIESESGILLHAKAVVICSGGVSRSLDVPGGELTVTPAAAFSLQAPPASLLVIGAGATGMQVASIFNAFGTAIVLCQSGPRIIPTEDEDVSAELARAFRDDGIDIYENCGRTRSFESVSGGVRTAFEDRTVETQLAVRCTGWIADTAGLDLAAAGVATDARGFVAIDEFFRTNVAHVYAAGDVIGHDMLVPQAARDGYLAGENAATGKPRAAARDVDPIGSFTDPEYAKVGLTEAQARERHDVLVATATYGETTRPIIDGRTRGFCKLVVDRSTLELLGAHIVGERAVEVSQMAAIAMTAHMKIGDLARIPFSFPTYANVFGRAAMRAAREL